MADLCWMILFPYKNDSQIFFKFRYCWYMSEFFLKITWGFWCKNAEKLQVFKTVARLRAGPKSLFWSKALFGTIPRPAEMQVLKRKLVWCLNFSTELKTMRTVKLDRFPRPDGRQEKDNQRGGCEASHPRRTEDSMGWTPNSKLFGVIFESLETTTGWKDLIFLFFFSLLKIHLFELHPFFKHLSGRPLSLWLFLRNCKTGISPRCGNAASLDVLPGRKEETLLQADFGNKFSQITCLSSEIYHQPTKNAFSTKSLSKLSEQFLWWKIGKRVNKSLNKKELKSSVGWACSPRDS